MLFHVDYNFYEMITGSDAAGTHPRGCGARLEVE